MRKGLNTYILEAEKVYDVIFQQNHLKFGTRTFHKIVFAHVKFGLVPTKESGVKGGGEQNCQHYSQTLIQTVFLAVSPKRNKESLFRILGPLPLIWLTFVLRLMKTEARKFVATFSWTDWLKPSIKLKYQIPKISAFTLI